MAIPVKETPVLTGKDALAFEKKIKENEGRKVSSENYQRAMNVFSKVIEVKTADQ